MYHRSMEEEFDAVVAAIPDYCSCSCHVSAHEIGADFDGAGLRMACREEFHRCDRLPVILQRPVAEAVKQYVKDRASRQSRYKRADATHELIGAIQSLHADVRRIASEGVKRR